MAAAEAGDTMTRSERAAPAPAAAPRLPLVFAVVCAGFVMANLDMMIVNVAFPAIQRDFAGSTAAGLSWTLNGYSIVYAALLIPAGRLADRTSRRLGFLTGLGLFTAASALCAAAPGVGLLIAARVVQAAGAAALTPTSLGLLLAAYPAERRGGAVRAWTAAGGMSAALAPIIGGALVNLDWRWIFLINLPIGVAAMVLGRRVLPDSRAAARGPRPDLAGAVLLIAGIGLVALGLVKAPEWGWASIRVLGSLAAAAVLLALFLLRCARHPSPVLSLELLRVRSFSLANVATLGFGSCFAAMLLSVMLWSQDVWGYSALRTGLALAPGTFLMPFVAMRSGGIVKRIGPAATVAVGCALLSAGVAWWAVAARLSPDYVTVLLPGAVLTPVGTILALTTLVTLATRDLPPGSYATGAAVNTMVRQVGFVIGVSAFLAVLGVPAGPGATLAAFRHGWALTVGFGLLAAMLGLLLGHRRTAVPVAA